MMGSGPTECKSYPTAIYFSDQRSGPAYRAGPRAVFLTEPSIRGQRFRLFSNLLA